MWVSASAVQTLCGGEGRAEPTRPEPTRPDPTRPDPYPTVSTDSTAVYWRIQIWQVFWNYFGAQIGSDYRTRTVLSLVLLVKMEEDQSVTGSLTTEGGNGGLFCCLSLLFISSLRRIKAAAAVAPWFINVSACMFWFYGLVGVVCYFFSPPTGRGVRQQETWVVSLGKGKKKKNKTQEKLKSRSGCRFLQPNHSLWPRSTLNLEQHPPPQEVFHLRMFPLRLGKVGLNLFISCTLFLI